MLVRFQGIYDHSSIETYVDDLSEKLSNVQPSFGTLAITLPTRYSDGVVDFSHAGTRVVEARHFSTFDATYAAWYAFKSQNSVTDS